MNDDRFTWAHCPECGKTDDWLSDPLLVEMAAMKCGCGYSTDDPTPAIMADLPTRVLHVPGGITPHPQPESEPVTRCERFIHTILRANTGVLPKWNSDTLDSFVKDPALMSDEMAKWVVLFARNLEKHMDKDNG